MGSIDRLNEIFRRVLKKPDLTLRAGMTADDVPGWDSLRHVKLVVAVEQSFGVKFETGEILKLTSVSGLLAAIDSKKKQPRD